MSLTTEESNTFKCKFFNKNYNYELFINNKIVYLLSIIIVFRTNR